ncbi:MAG TPA: hypothetical protein GXZ58_10845 [Bacilli bacterium]|nr:hypothetical protein [Bacilli bacterium]
MDEVNKLPEADKIFEIPISYEEKEIGRKEGSAIAMRNVVVEMLRKDLDLNFIAEITHLDIEEIKDIQKEL